MSGHGHGHDHVYVYDCIVYDGEHPGE